MIAVEPPRRSLGRSARSAFQASRPLRFLIVGGFNTMLCYIVYAGLLWIGLLFWAANLGAVVFGIGVSFITQGRIVFGNSDGRRIGRFVASWLVIYAAQTAIIGLLMRTGITPTIAGLIVLPGAAVCSYLIQKRLVFRAARLAA